MFNFSINTNHAIFTYVSLRYTEFLFLGVPLALLLACHVGEGTQEYERSSYSALNNVNLWNTFVEDDTYTIPWRLSDGIWNDTRKYIPIVAKQLEENTCLRFKPWKGESSWLLLFPVLKICSANYGRPEGQRVVSFIHSLKRVKTDVVKFEHKVVVVVNINRI